jgi:endo-1,4-beta-xylanase
VPDPFPRRRSEPRRSVATSRSGTVGEVAGTRGSGGLTRRAFLGAAAAAFAGTVAGCSGTEQQPRPRSPSPTLSSPSPVECAALDRGGAASPLWETAMRRGLVYGSSTATWQISDPGYRRLFVREAAMLFTEDDLLWYRLRPTPTSDLDFRYGDRIVRFAEDHGMLVLGAHLVWDEGFGEGWTENDLSALDERAARDLLFGTVEAVVRRYRGRVAAWIVANEVFDGFGIRAEVPWYGTIGPSYVEEGFHLAHDADPDAALLINDYGFETGDGTSSAADRRGVALDVVDDLLAKNVPVHGFGIQAHLTAGGFAERFDPPAYRAFLGELAERGLKILITEMDVLDDGEPEAIGPRDLAVADTYRRYLDTALQEPAIAALTTFGLSDRYTWLQEDFPREDGAARRPLVFDEQLEPKPAFAALHGSLAAAARRTAAWTPPRC